MQLSTSTYDIRWNKKKVSKFIRGCLMNPTLRCSIRCIELQYKRFAPWAEAEYSFVGERRSYTCPIFASVRKMLHFVPTPRSSTVVLHSRRVSVPRHGLGRR